MFRKYVKINTALALLLLFVVCYQSLHIFLDNSNHHIHCLSSTKIEKSEYKKVVKEKDECPVCEFEFAAFLSSEVFTFNFVNPPYKFHFIDSYQSIVKEKEFVYFSHRGPPAFY